MDLAEVLRLAERADEAASACRHAIGLYEQKGNVASSPQAGEVLAELRR